MGFAQVLSRAQIGLHAPLVRVEVHLGSGLPTFTIVGLPTAVVRESKERVRAALAHCGFEFPAGRITVNLAPADLRKEGGRFDLPMAMGILLASGQIESPGDVSTAEFYGELALTGELKPVPALLAAALEAEACGHRFVIPAANVADVRLADALQVSALRHLRELMPGAEPEGAPVVSAQEVSRAAPPPQTVLELADVKGQWQAKRALLIAAAGGHSLLMVGSPGSGKSMLAQRLPALLPPLSRSEALEVAAIAAVAQGVNTAPGHRPFRAPHHTASAQSIVGGGALVRPGEVSLAHHGVLFLDELPEFDRRVLEGLREPLESGTVSVVRTQQRAEYPARFQLVAAMNPCPCGYAGMVRPRCRCEPSQIQHYRARISGPLLDRIDLQIQLAPVSAAELVAPSAAQQRQPEQCTATAAAAVFEARQRQVRRQGKHNAALDPEGTLRHCAADSTGLQLLRRATETHGYSARSQHRILRVARTIADLEGREAVTFVDLGEALAMRWQD